jgi:leucyl aminopeptidase
MKHLKQRTIVLFSSMGLNSMLAINVMASEALPNEMNRENTVATKPILSDLRLLNDLGIKTLHVDTMTGVAYAEVNALDEIRIQERAHEWGRCGGYEVLSTTAPNIGVFDELVNPMRVQIMRNNLLAQESLNLESKDSILKAVAQVSAANIKQSVEWFSAYPNRFNRGNEANKPIYALQERLSQMHSNAINSKKPSASWIKKSIKIDLVDHTRTPQKSVRVRIEGANRPHQLVVLGGHVDSISSSGAAPGADDNASGSSNLIEIFRILLEQDKAPQRSIEMFWYAGEESGLLGSAEIADQYKKDKKQVVGVVQLDMTLHAGSGELVMASMTDFTDLRLRTFLEEINRLYVGATFVNDRCGYACSDHASWHRNGFPTVMPFEAKFSQMNRQIHTPHDVINSRSNFIHSAAFSKLALAFALELSDSEWSPQ